MADKNAANLLTKRDFLKLTIESVLIVFSVLLALGLNEFRSNYKENIQKKQALQKIINELQSNLEIVREWEPYHKEVFKNLQEAQKKYTAGKDIFTVERKDLQKLMPRGVVQSLIDDTAWQALKASSIFARIDFENAVTLAKIYKLQAIGVESTINSILDVLTSRESLKKENSRETMILLTSGFGELVSQESFLIHYYEKTLQEFENMNKS
ncbi:MAG: hypothetical protein DWQ05_18505 [Calditrichaeota bacterium]|nr:MAG: hypothetical protein DWQ05_18505 [Calditrichota bacterium]